MPAVYEWPRRSEFLGRGEELERLEAWWASDERMPVNLYGRRRVGKSWLLRRFAHGKPAVILVADRLAEGAQLSRFARQLAPLVGGVTPDLPDVATLVRTLFRLAGQTQLLAVIDEFPWLLGTTASASERVLSEVQAVMEEERDTSRLKLVLCGSAVGQMEALQSERSALHGRLVPLEVRTLDYGGAEPYLRAHQGVERFTRYAVAGGMPRYLAAIADGPLEAAIVDQVLRPDAPLWNEGRTIVGQELREPAMYFALLEQLASGAKTPSELANALRRSTSEVSAYLANLGSLRLVRRETPIGAEPGGRISNWELADPFLRFWFRFVFPYQSDLEAGLDARALYRAEVAPALADHVSPAFEAQCRTFVRSTLGDEVTRVGRWWGKARHELRRVGRRSTEEIDIVGLLRGQVTVVGEAKWTSRSMDLATLRDLQEHKLPALRQSGFRIASEPTTVLMSRSGFTRRLMERAGEDPQLRLFSATDVLSG